MMVPYFAVLLVLSCYGLHRYEMIRGYWKHRKKFTEVPPQRYAQLPRVTIQLPIYNEQYVVERLIEATSKMEYPRELLRNSGPRRFHRRNASLHRSVWSPNIKPPAIPSNTSIAATATATRPARCRTA